MRYMVHGVWSKHPVVHIPLPVQSTLQGMAVPPFPKWTSDKNDGIPSQLVLQQKISFLAHEASGRRKKEKNSPEQKTQSFPLPRVKCNSRQGRKEQGETVTPPPP
uniref:Uncharacterized protein n=1 Tax=Eutreptiella gymnastica TaxID=73025 RepID=A0A7S1NK27_9EUGL